MRSRRPGFPWEPCVFVDEGHGIYKRGNKSKFYVQLLTFLNKHLGGRMPVVPAADAGK